MAANRKILSLPGDGICTEGKSEVEQTIEWLDKRFFARCDVYEIMLHIAAFC